MRDLLKRLEQETVVDARNKTAIIPYQLSPSAARKRI
jgi:hypothetical protein